MDTVGDERRSRILFLALAALFLVAVVLLVYLPSPGDYWIHYDNEGLIRNVPRVQALSLSGWVEGLQEIFASPHHNLYQPLFTLSVATDHYLFGWNREGFHAHSLVLHLLSVLALFFLAFRLTRSLPAAGLAALLPALHPVMVETVYWTICRNSLVTVLYLLVATHLYLGYVRFRGRWGLLVGAQVLYGLSLLGKLTAAPVLLPFVVDLWTGRPQDRRAWLEKVPLLVLTILVAAVNLEVTRGLSDSSVLVRPWTEVLALAPTSVALMLGNVVWPTRLSLFYAPLQSSEILGWRLWLVLAAAVLALVWGSLLWKRGRRGFPVAVVSAVLVLLPNLAAGRYRETLAADRYLYVSVFFLALALAALAEAGLSPGSIRRRTSLVLAVAVMAGALMVLVPQSRAQVRKWAQEEELWKDAAALGRHPTPHRSLGKLAADSGDWGAALQHLETAKELAVDDPYAAHDPTLYETLAQVARKLAVETAARTSPKDLVAPSSEQSGQRDEAGEDLEMKAAKEVEKEIAALLETAEEAVETGLREAAPDPGLLFELGKTHYKQGRFDEAEVSLRQALDLDPGHFQALTYLAMVVFRQERTEEAEGIFLRSLEVDSSEENWLALSNLGKVYQSLGRFSEAADLALKWARLAPRTQVAHQRFLEAVAALAQRGDLSVARRLLDNYRETFPTLPQAKLMLAQVYLAEGDLKGAEPLLVECLAADSENKWIQQTLAQVRQQLER